MLRKHVLSTALCLTALIGGVPGAAPADASGAGVFEYAATGTLPAFPSDTTRSAYISGTVTGNGQVSALVNGTPITANITLKTAAFSNQPIEYNVASFPYCLAASQASSNATYPYNGFIGVSASAPTVSGQVYRWGNTVMGTVTAVDISFRFTYQRVGAATMVVVNPGNVTVHYNTVGQGSGSFSSTFLGAGPGAVSYTDPAAAVRNCVLGPPGPVSFAVTGNVNVAGA